MRKNHICGCKPQYYTPPNTNLAFITVFTSCMVTSMSHTLFCINYTFMPSFLKVSIFLCFSGWNKCSSSCNIKTRVWCHILWQWHKIWTLQQPFIVMETLMQHDIYRETYRYSTRITFQLYAQVVGLYLSVLCSWWTGLLHMSNLQLSHYSVAT